MDVDFWAARVHSQIPSVQSSRLGNSGNHSLVEDEGGDEVRAWFPCPFCYVEIELPMLCVHLQEEHCFALKNAVCPICAANLGRDAIGHFAAQHAHSIKRRKKSQKSGFWSSASSNIIRDLRELSSFLGSNSPNGKEASLDPLAPFLCTVPLPVSKDSKEDEPCVAATSDAESRTSRLDEDKVHNHEETKQRVAFVQDLIFSTIF
ncbi:protein DEHYDRATION-INDUCED 19 homolog 5-like isoform X2 [Salvia miltiorrhiza]|uniref:protein DEHYDRATION-INDUCED 19 homolog 5-like isoform X2 n=1 Tax=Salvia miltiorrhiza TaxID=226208 RepID=UPI0025AD9B9E|nr:protein DEHYDRATION-INDUCED 19 homolog 5-like isoform X2 [Salvia miltiorrhiza]